MTIQRRFAPIGGRFEPESVAGFAGIYIKKIEYETTLLGAKIDQNSLESMKKAINLIINLRHSFQHGGLPNLMHSLYYKSNEEKYLKMLNPKNYIETKETFQTAEKFLKFLPQLTIIITEK